MPAMISRLLLFVALSLVTQFSEAQSHIPLLDTNSVWQTATIESFGIPGSNNFSVKSIEVGDTVHVDSMIYYQVGGVLLREDSLGRVFQHEDSTEALLYDFSMQVGDSIGFYDWSNEDTTMAWLNSIDSVILGNATRRRFNFVGGASRQWIEGIGDVRNGLLYRTQYTVWHVTVQFDCFSYNGQPVLGSCTPLSVTENEANGFRAQVFPNPASERLTVRWDHLNSSKPLTFTLTDLLGREVLQQQSSPHSQQAELPVENLPSGTYILTTKLADTLLAVQKVNVSR